MATKDELLAFCEQHGIQADASMLKADIEAAVAAAGYDPTTLEEASTVSEVDWDEAADVLENSSSDAAFSTYAEVAPDPEVRPAPGRQVEQTRGEAQET